ncbi:signal peptidase II [Spongiivirga citrea]|uniref:Lipoprotein signal peptidase n=1 Tax=Spongiivirga citrea TaxID=1481457 RepID=A0A6M0CTK7_9FLAO|nr:signal peptidase II [Spongiivirga citrea]
MKKYRIPFILLLVFLNIGCDQVSKIIVRDNIDKNANIELIGDYFVMTNVYNYGAFLGMGSEMSPVLKYIFLLILPSIVLILVFRHLLVKKDLSMTAVIGLAFLLGGGIGNIYDRLMHKRVIDFFHIDLGGVFKTGIFNMADVSVMVGMGFVLYSSIIKKQSLGL